SDIVGRCHSLVNAICSSGSHCEAFHKLVTEGNEKGFWQVQLPTHKLSCDCETHWSSSHSMIEWFVELFLAIQAFIMHNLEITAHHHISEQDVSVLCDILQVLESPHHAQELLSGEKTPTLSQAIPTYEDVIDYWKELHTTIPELEYYINVGITKLEEYMCYAQKTQIYTHAMGMHNLISFI
ncbi:hypothetical protein P691DRAFT_676122, partial [Macrolepiota fuliginosa MF-IS2]